MIKKLLVFFLTIFTMTAYAQNITMTGTVVDTDNLPLIGVNVVIRVLLPVLLLIWMVSLLLLEKMDKHWFSHI